jgi:predicted alpha/beta-hydrolase family hydrolase
VENDTRLSPKRMLMSGKSLGGRMASLLAAEGGRADGLVFFGYPLHPAGRQDKLRSAHFETISCPALFVQGTRDPLCNLDLLREEIIDKAPRLRALHIIDGGDHSFRVPKKLGRTEQSVFEEIAEATHRWIRARVPG